MVFDNKVNESIKNLGFDLESFLNEKKQVIEI